MTSDNSSVDATLDKALSFMGRTFGFNQFRPGQQNIISAVIDGSDVLAVMPTGGGKSLCYQVPGLISPGISLVVSPLIALMKDQVDTLRVLDLPVGAIHSLMSLREQEDVLRRVGAGEIKLLYVSPERLRNQQFLQTLKTREVDLVAVDEAHCISQWGHDFRPDYLRIKHALNFLGKPQTIALTATAPEKVRTDIIDNLELQAPRVFVTGFDRRNLFWEVQAVGGEKEKIAHLSRRIMNISGGVIIYTGTRKNVDKIVASLEKIGIMALGYHAGMEKDERSRVQETFMEGRSDLVVATNAFGMGIDRADIRMVIHHTFPGSVEAYYQEGGRAGRDGEPATCLLLYSPGDRRLQEFFIRARYPDAHMVWEVWSRIRKRPEDVLWLTYRELGMMGEENIPEIVVGSCIKILEDAGAIQRLNRYDNRAELYFHIGPEELLKAIPARASSNKTLLEFLVNAYGGDQLREGIQFLPHDLAETVGVSIDALRRSLSRMDADRKISYIPPFRGRGIRVLKRVKPGEFSIDFEELRVRKAYELMKLDKVMAYAGENNCRRKYLLRYFGEHMEGENCGACDICAMRKNHPEISIPAHDLALAVKILSGIARLKGRFGISMAAKMLTGSTDHTLLSLKLNRLSTYGILQDLTQVQVQEYIRELIYKGLIASRRISLGDKSYPILDLTGRGREVMKGNEEIALSIPERPVKRVDNAALAFSAPERKAFDRLRELRAGIAKQEGLPPYCIFQDRTLKEMARVLPLNKQQLLGIVGVGEVTFRKYGRTFLDLIRDINDKESN